MTQVIQQTGENTVLFGEWAITNEYLEGAIVIREGDLWAANANIPANTAFLEGTTGQTWLRVLTTMKPTVNPQLRISEDGSTAYGRLHVWGNRVFSAGHASGSNILHGQGQPEDIGRSTELYCLDGAPNNWVKFQDTLSNFYGLGDDGILRVAGTNSSGSLGLGESVSNSFHIINQTHPLLYGPGIQVLDFWATNQTMNTTTRSSSCWVQVDDNGVLRLYSFGYNSTGSIGNGTTSTDAFTPFEHIQMIGKRVKTVKSVLISGASWSVLVTQDGEAWSTGFNDNGMLANGTTNTLTTLTQCKYDAGTYVTDAIDIDTGISYGSYGLVCILRANGTVWSAGNNSTNILGIGSQTAPTFVSYFMQVRSTATAPLTGIVKIKAMDRGLAALDNQGQVWITGKNNDGFWGNGEAAEANGQTWATVKQAGIKDMWFSKTGRGFMAAYWLTTDNRFLASGGNHYYQLGIATPVAQNVTNNLQAIPVALPRGEYPVQVRWAGGVQLNGSTSAYDMLGGAIIMVSNSNKLYVWGRPYTRIHGIKGTVTSLRYPHCVNDFYDVRFI